MMTIKNLTNDLRVEVARNISFIESKGRFELQIAAVREINAFGPRRERTFGDDRSRQFGGHRARSTIR